MAKSARTENLGGVVRGGELYRGKQGLDYTPGVSAQTVGSRALWLGDAPSGRRADQGPYPRATRVRVLHDQRRRGGSVHRRAARASGRRPRRRLPVLPCRGAPRGGQSQRGAGGVRRGADRTQRAGERGDAAGAGREGALVPGVLRAPRARRTSQNSPSTSFGVCGREGGWVL